MQWQKPSNPLSFGNLLGSHPRSSHRSRRWLYDCRSSVDCRRHIVRRRRRWRRRRILLTYEIQHLLLDLRPRATALVVAINLIDVRVAAPGVKMDSGYPSDLKLWRDVISKGVLDPFVVGYDNVRKDHRRSCKFGIPVQCLEFLFQHSTSRANRAGKLQKDELVGISAFEIPVGEEYNIGRWPVWWHAYHQNENWVRWWSLCF